MLSVEIIFTVSVWLTFLSLNQSKGSGWVCFIPTLTLFSDAFISKTFTLTLSPFLYLANSSSVLFKYVKSLQCRKASMSEISPILTKSEYSFLLATSPSTTVPTGYFFSKLSNGFSCASLWEIATRLLSLLISVISKGSGDSCFTEQPTCNFSLSTVITLRSCFSPILKTSSGWFILE